MTTRTQRQVRCVRCGQFTKDGSRLGPECREQAAREFDAFCKHQFGTTAQEFADGCMADFATGYEGSHPDGHQTLEEYKEENGDLGKDLDWLYDSLWNHGLTWVRRGNEIKVAVTRGC